MARDQEVVESDKRLGATVDALVQQRDPMLEVEKVLSPTMRGIAAVLRANGLDEYARHIDDLARRIARSCRDTRLLLEQLDTLTDPRLEQTEPRIPAPPNGG